MDLAADLYFMADPDEEQRLIRSSIAACIPAPRLSILEEETGGRVSPRDVLIILGLSLGARRRLRTSILATILNDAAGAAKSASIQDASIEDLARRFWSARRLIPAAPACLADSLALIGWLSRFGLASSLIFGVKLDPFAAHCWVQSGELLLSDRLEEIERFTPVRIVACMPATR